VIALFVVVSDPVGRFILGFVVLVCVVQLCRFGRLMRTQDREGRRCRDRRPRPRR
jgi:hypothetical protein